MRLGEAAFSFEPVGQWPTLPPGFVLGEVADVGVDADDLVYLFNRGPHPVIVVSADGDYVRSWGEGLFLHAHGLFIAPDQTVWLTDDRSHSVRHCTRTGELLQTIGNPGVAAPTMSGQPFCACTSAALSPTGEIYVADGYRNACVHKFAPDGRLISSWGSSGSGAGQFNVVHNVVCDSDGWVYVVDRENHRIQVFDGDGTYQTQWNNLHRPCGLFIPRGRWTHCFVPELPPVMPVNRTAPNLGPRISVLNREGRQLATIGDCIPGAEPGRFVAPHGIAFDSAGNLYLADVAVSTWPQCLPDQPMPPDLRTIHKLRTL